MFIENTENEKMKLWIFKVKYEPKNEEKVCITGDCDSLGNWSAKNIIPLSYDEYVFFSQQVYEDHKSISKLLFSKPMLYFVFQQFRQIMGF